MIDHVSNNWSHYNLFYLKGISCYWVLFDSSSLLLLFNFPVWNKLKLMFFKKCIWSFPTINKNCAHKPDKLASLVWRWLGFRVSALSIFMLTKKQTEEKINMSTHTAYCFCTELPEARLALHNTVWLWPHLHIHWIKVACKCNKR